LNRISTSAQRPRAVTEPTTAAKEDGDAGTNQRSGSKDTAGDVFQTTAPAFVAEAEGKLTGLDDTLAECKNVYADVATFFGENVKKSGAPPTHEWLGFLNRFLEDLQKSVMALRAHQEKQRRAQTKKRRSVSGRKSQSIGNLPQAASSQAEATPTGDEGLQHPRLTLPGATNSETVQAEPETQSHPEVPSSAASRTSSCSASSRLHAAGFSLPRKISLCDILPHKISTQNLDNVARGSARRFGSDPGLRTAQRKKHASPSARIRSNSRSDRRCRRSRSHSRTGRAGSISREELSSLKIHVFPPS